MSIYVRMVVLGVHGSRCEMMFAPRLTTDDQHADDQRYHHNHRADHWALVDTWRAAVADRPATRDRERCEALLHRPPDGYTDGTERHDPGPDRVRPLEP